MILLLSRRVLCTPYRHTRTPYHLMESHIRKVDACLAVTCHLHCWQNDRDLLRAAAVTRGWNGYRNKSQHRKSFVLVLYKKSKKSIITVLGIARSAMLHFLAPFRHTGSTVIGYGIKGALLLSTRSVYQNCPCGLTLSVPTVQFAKSLSTKSKTVAATLYWRFGACEQRESCEGL